MMQDHGAYRVFTYHEEAGRVVTVEKCPKCGLTAHDHGDGIISWETGTRVTGKEQLNAST